MFTRTFWRDAAERVISTFAEAMGGALLAAGTMSAVDADWGHAASVAAFTAALALLKALAAGQVNDPQSASLVDLPGKHAADQ